MRFLVLHFGVYTLLVSRVSTAAHATIALLVAHHAPRHYRAPPSRYHEPLYQSREADTSNSYISTA
eukprot:2077703-Rhodomonas_salina.2